MAAGSAVQRPYFAFEGELRPVPDHPTHCGRCRAELEPLRRWGGLCAKCIRKRGKASAQRVVEPHYELITEYMHKKPNGHRERYVRVRCSCGRKSRMSRRTWLRRRPAGCHRCRLRTAGMLRHAARLAACARLDAE